jgi:hypothetical protein
VPSSLNLATYSVPSSSGLRPLDQTLPPVAVADELVGVVVGLVVAHVDDDAVALGDVDEGALVLQADRARCA